MMQTLALIHLLVSLPDQAVIDLTCPAARGGLGLGVSMCSVALAVSEL